ncbi:MAG: nucleotidyl transferase AbiEii/AbiGii toxin family protein [Candidatus Acidiferrales bacterium]
MIFLSTMSIEDRVRRYTDRGFQTFEAEILVLIEESAAAIFTSFPDHFILFGGAALVLFYESPRLSRDLDLLTSPGPLPQAEEIQGTVRTAIQPIAEVFGLGQLEFRNNGTSAGFTRHWVLANQQPLFSIDLTGIGGSVLKTQIVKYSIASESEKTILSPTANYLLLQKCETFLNRRFVKARDAFDIDLLLNRGAHLDKNLHAHLEDFVAMREIDPAQLDDRIRRIDHKLCTVELRPVLPAAIFEDLANHEFEPIRQSLRVVFADWLQE